MPVALPPEGMTERIPASPVAPGTPAAAASLALETRALYPSGEIFYAC